MTRTPAGPTLVWRGGADQISHAFVMRRDARRTLCGRPIVDVRLAWPPVVRCPECLVASGVKGVAMGL